MAHVKKGDDLPACFSKVVTHIFSRVDSAIKPLLALDLKPNLMTL